MELAISLIIITISILISYVLIIDYIRKGKYKVKGDASILSKEAEDRYFNK